MTPLELKLLPEYRFTTTDPSAFLGQHHHEIATTAYMRMLFRQYFHPSHPSIDLDTQESIWQMIGCYKDDPYLNLVDKARRKRAPPPRYDSIPGISTGNGSWPAPATPWDGKDPYSDCGVKVPPGYEFLLGGDGKAVHMSEDLRLSTPPSDRLLRAEAREGLIPSVYLIGSPERPYYSEPNRDVRFPDAVAHYLKRHVCPEHLRKLLGRYPNGHRDWITVYRMLHGWEEGKTRQPFRAIPRADPWRSRTFRRDEESSSSSVSTGSSSREVPSHSRPSWPDVTALAKMRWTDVLALISAIPRDKRRTAVLSKKRYGPRETSLREMN